MLVKSKVNFPQTPFKLISLTNGLKCKVDPDRFPDLDRVHWRAVKSFSKIYACHAYRQAGKIKVIRMHRLVAGTPPGQVCHHINGDTLDNRRINLRNMTLFDHTKMHSYR